MVGFKPFQFSLVYLCTITPQLQNMNCKSLWTYSAFSSFFLQKAIKEKEIPIEGLEFMGHGKEKPENSS